MDSRGSSGDSGSGGGSVAVLVDRLPCARGVELAALVAALTDPDTLAGLSDSQRLEVAAASLRLDGWSAAARGRAVAALHASVLADVRGDAADLAAHSHALPAQRSAGSTSARDAARDAARDGMQERQLADRRVAMELSLVLGCSFAVADRELDLALDLAAFPRIAAALADGRLDLRQARVILDAVNAVNAPDSARVIDAEARTKHQDRLIAGLLGAEPAAAEPAADEEAASRLFRELTRPGVTLWGLPPARLRAILAREAARLDPGFLVERAAAARAARRLDYQDHADATASLHLHTSTVHTAAAYRNIDAAARAARRDGDPRSLDQLRADITIGWLTEGAHGTLVVRPTGKSRAVPPSESEPAEPPRESEPAEPPRESEPADDASLELLRPDVPLVHVTVAATTLLGADEEPATLHGPAGPVPIPAELARALASRRGARWRRLLFDPRTGTATDLTPIYRPRAMTHAFVRARDGDQSRFPTSSATRLELDHVREYRHDQPTAGGPTEPANLAAAGKRDHQLKTDRLITVHGDANHQLTYTTPAGRQYVSHPAALADPRRPPPF